MKLTISKKFPDTTTVTTVNIVSVGQDYRILKSTIKLISLDDIVSQDVNYCSYNN